MTTDLRPVLVEPSRPSERELATEQQPLPGPVPIIIQAPPQQRSPLGMAVQVVGLLILLTILVGFALMVMAVASLVGVPGRIASDVGGTVGNIAAEAGRVVGSAGQALRDATDPSRPPTGLTYDVEFTALRVLQVQDRLPEAREYVLTVREIRRRDGAESPDVALYAVVHAELRQPRETRVLGQVVRTDSDPRDHFVYKGEAFRIGRAYYRVNWISREQGTLAIALYRHPDAVTGSLKFEYD